MSGKKIDFILTGGDIDAAYRSNPREKLRQLVRANSAHLSIFAICFFQYRRVFLHAHAAKPSDSPPSQRDSCSWSILQLRRAIRKLSKRRARAISRLWHPRGLKASHQTTNQRSLAPAWSY